MRGKYPIGSLKFWDAAGVEDPDGMCLRFLRARNFNVGAAFSMFEASLRWREEFSVDLITEDDVDDSGCFSSGSMFFHGYCKAGRPIATILVRLYNKKEVDLDSMKKFTVLQLEWGKRLVVASRAKYPNCDTCVILFDMTHFRLVNMNFEFVKFLVVCLERYYPETLGHVFVLDAPWVFSGCWKVIKPWLDPNVVKKIVFCNKKELKEYIDDENLLEMHGGTSKFEYKYSTPASDGASKYVDVPYALKANEDFDDMRNKVYELQIECDKITDRILAVEAQMESNGEAPQAGFFAGRSTFNEKLEEDFNSGRVSDPKDTKADEPVAANSTIHHQLEQLNKMRNVLKGQIKQTYRYKRCTFDFMVAYK